MFRSNEGTQCGDAADASFDSPYTGIATALRRGVMLCVGLVALTILSHIVVRLPSQPIPQATSHANAERSPLGEGAVQTALECTDAVATVGVALFGPLSGALCALGLGSLLVLAAGRSPRAGATVASVAIAATVVVSADSIGETIVGLSSHWASLACLGLSLFAIVLLAWRWTEELALAAALAARLEVKRLATQRDQAALREADREASQMTHRGVELRDDASRVLARVLGTDRHRAQARQNPEELQPPEQLGFGSPLRPQMQPTNEPDPLPTPPKVDSTFRAA